MATWLTSCEHWFHVRRHAYTCHVQCLHGFASFECWYIQILYLQLVTLQTSRSERWYHRLSCRDGWIPRLLCCLKSRGGNHSRPWMPMQDDHVTRVWSYWHMFNHLFTSRHSIVLPSPMPFKANHVRSSWSAHHLWKILSFHEGNSLLNQEKTNFLWNGGARQSFHMTKSYKPQHIGRFSKGGESLMGWRPPWRNLELQPRTIPHPTRSNLRSAPWISMDLGSNVAFISRRALLY